MISEIPANEIPQGYFSDPYHHIIAQSLLQQPRSATRCFVLDDARYAVYHPDLGFGYANPKQEALEDWARWMCESRLPLIAGELHSHYALLQTMGQILPEDGPLQVLCRYEFQDFCIFTAQATAPEGVKLKRAKPEDIHKLFHFYEKSETMQARSRENLLHTITHNRLFYLQKTGKIVAAALTHCESEKAALIGGVYTPASYRGKGYAALCMQALMASLQAEHKTPCLFYEKNNQAARRLYQKLGFIPYGEWVVIELTYEDREPS